MHKWITKLVLSDVFFEICLLQKIFNNFASKCSIYLKIPQSRPYLLNKANSKFCQICTMNYHVKYGNSWATLESGVNVLIFGVESQNTIRNGISKTKNDLKHSMFSAPP